MTTSEVAILTSILILIAPSVVVGAPPVVRFRFGDATKTCKEVCNEELQQSCDDFEMGKMNRDFGYCYAKMQERVVITDFGILTSSDMPRKAEGCSAQVNINNDLAFVEWYKNDNFCDANKASEDLDSFNYERLCPCVTIPDRKPIQTGSKWYFTESTKTCTAFCRGRGQTCFEDAQLLANNYKWHCRVALSESYQAWVDPEKLVLMGNKDEQYPDGCSGWWDTPDYGWLILHGDVRGCDAPGSAVAGGYRPCNCY